MDWQCPSQDPAKGRSLPRSCSGDAGNGTRDSSRHSRWWNASLRTPPVARVVGDVFGMQGIPLEQQPRKQRKKAKPWHRFCEAGKWVRGTTFRIRRDLLQDASGHLAGQRGATPLVILLPSPFFPPLAGFYSPRDSVEASEFRSWSSSCNLRTFFFPLGVGEMLRKLGRKLPFGILFIIQEHEANGMVQWLEH